MNLSEPDKRLRDIENLLRLFAFTMYPKEYKGNLKKFLDDKMGDITKNWGETHLKIKEQYEKINSAIDLLKKHLGIIKLLVGNMTKMLSLIDLTKCYLRWRFFIFFI